jgi:pimeloyl-ACP methyl ester carboxylesterase
MGGLIGMLLAAQPSSPIRKLVMNDVGPFIPKSALERIATYVGKAPTYDSIEGLEKYIRTVSASFGPLTDAQWRHLTQTSARQGSDGQWGTNYDPGIALPFAAAIADVVLWPYWDQIRCPTLVLRGQESDLLLRETALEMSARGPKAQLVEFAGTGHAPMLMERSQMEVVREFLEKP